MAGNTDAGGAARTDMAGDGLFAKYDCAELFEFLLVWQDDSSGSEEV